MIITHKVTMDLAQCGKITHIDAVQDDRYTRNVALSLYEDGKAWKIPEEAAVLIRYRKSDGTGGQYDALPDGTAAWSVSGNVLTLALAPQVLTAAGLVNLSAQLTLAEQVLSTFAMLIHVQADPALGGVASEDYVNVGEEYLSLLDGKLNRSGWTPNRYLGTDDRGNVVEKDAADALPAVTGADDGKFLRVRDGTWTAESLEYAEEVAY